MAMPVLATKLFVPQPRPRAVQRVRLTARLDEGLRANRRLTLVTAPAGFGKTTLVSEWIAGVSAREPEVRVAWLSLEEGDNDPARFAAYLIAAVSGADPSVVWSELAPQQPVEAALTTLINEIATSDYRILLVLDDFQVIDDASIREAIAFLVDHLPQNLHVTIASRSDPLFPVARLRARGELSELRASDLRFTPEEAAAFLNSAMGLSLTADDVAALDKRTEGWIAGLQLAALSLQDRTDVPEFIAAFTGSNRFVIDYLVEEVLDRAAPDVREFLHQTAILERLSGPLCDAVTERPGGAGMLEALDKANLFVIPLDDERRWFRYHHLFADVLRVRLLADRPADSAELHARASAWFEQNDAPADAVRHAFEASDFSRAARVIEATIPSVRKSRQDATLLGWLSALPGDTVARRPVLTVFSAWSALVSGDFAAVEPLLVRAEQLLAATGADGMPDHESELGEELRSLPVTIELYRAAVAMATGDEAGIKSHAARALESALPDDHLGRGAAAGLLGLAASARGELTEGVAAFAVSGASLRLAGNLTDALSTTMVIADMLLPLGRLRDAESAYETALAESIAHGNNGPPSSDLRAGLAGILVERNQLAEASQLLLDSDELGAGSFSREHRYRWFVAMAGVRSAEGNPDAALALLAEAAQHYRRGFFPDARPIGGMAARIHIATGDLAAARLWIEEQGLTAADELSYLAEFGHITLARLLIAEQIAGGDVTQATLLLERLLEAAQLGERAGSSTEILVLQALALQARGESAPALESLERALEVGEREGYVRLFVDEGAPMLGMLRVAASAGIHPLFVRQLTQALRVTEGTGPTLQPLVDPLSERELQVVRFLATELSGPEIARELHVSLNTLRTHTKHIFLKLDVTSRAAAVRRAEALGLI